MKTRCIYFDVGGVLLDWKQGLKNASVKYGVPLATIHETISIYWDSAGRGGDTAEYMQALGKLFRLKGPLPELTDFWSDYHTPISITHAFVNELKASFRLGIITNAEKNAMKHALKKGLIPDVGWDPIIDSSEVGLLKPEAGIFEIAERRVNLKPEELLFIDDIPEHIDSVVSRGWRGVVFDTDNPHRSIQRIRDALDR